MKKKFFYSRVSLQGFGAVKTRGRKIGAVNQVDSSQNPQPIESDGGSGSDGEQFRPGTV